jgi:uncharacterized membrane protein (UPF0182 family)
MLFLKRLVREVARRAAQDPRVRDTAKNIFENEIKPRAKTAWEKAKPEVEAAWEKAKPEVEAAWEKAKPEVEAAKRRALAKAADLADRVKRGIDESGSTKPGAPKADREQK